MNGHHDWPLGFVAARDLGDGRVKWWESRDGAHGAVPECISHTCAGNRYLTGPLHHQVPEHPVAGQCREDGLDDPDLLREVNAALTDDAREGR